MISKLSKNQKELVERFGVIQEGMGLTPAQARVNALLTVADATELTFDEIKDTLQISKSATSNAINTLITIEQIGYKTKPGDRRRYFFSKLDQWKTKFRKDISGLSEYNKVMTEILKNRTSKTKDFNIKMKELTEFMEYFMKESLLIIDRWNFKKK